MDSKNLSNNQIVTVKTTSQVIEETTLCYIAQNPSVLYNESLCSSGVTETVKQVIDLENTVRDKGFKLKAPQDITILSVAICISEREDVALIGAGDKSQSGRRQILTAEQMLKLPIVFYQSDGANKGVWEIANNPLTTFGILVGRYKPNATEKEKKEIFTLTKSRLQVAGKIVPKCVNPHYVAVNNGIWDSSTKQLRSFDPKIVFTSKIHTNLNLAATNPVITVPEDGSTWDVDSWLNSLGSPAFVESIKEVFQAACYNLVPWNKMVLFYSTYGCNSKGTICQTIRNIVGHNSAISIPLNKFSKQFELGDLPNATCIIVDENDVNDYITGLSTLKAIITSDVVRVEQKFQASYDYVFDGLVLQCVNALPRVVDKTGSFERRLHIIPFTQCFTGVERKYIKDRLIYRDDVLEYLLKMVLVDMPYRTAFTENSETQAALRDYVITNNSVVAFLDEILPKCKWDLLPATDFLYEIYKQWYRKVSPAGKTMGRNDFIQGLKEYVFTHTRQNPNFEWEWTDSCRWQGYIPLNQYEPLVDEYNIEPLKSVIYWTIHNSAYVHTNQLPVHYSGLKRRKAASPSQGTKTDN